MPHDEILDSLMALGFSTNEARAYKGLLVENPATGYEIAQRAGIPRSAIYAVLKRLEDEGMVARVEESPARYAPLPPTDLLGVLRRRFNRSLDELHANLRRVPPPPAAVDLWTVRGEEEIFERGRTLIEQAEAHLAASLWPSDLARLMPTLLAAHLRGVEVVLFSARRLSGELPFPHFCDDGDEPLNGGVRSPITLIADRRRALVVNQAPLAEAQAVVASHPAITEQALSNVALAISLWGLRHQTAVSSTLASLLGEKLGLPSSTDPTLRARAS